MANPNLTAVASATADVLVEAQLTTSNADSTVPADTAWKIESGTVCNVSAAAATVTISVLKTSASTARRVVSAYSLAAGDSLDLAPYLPRMLPAGAILRATASAGSAIDLVVSGTALG